MPSTRERTPDNPAGWATDPGALVYGLDLSRFADSDADGFGDLPGAMARLEYVASLGVTWIWLLPFYPSLRRDNGYDVDDHLAVDPRFGDLDDLRRFLARAHDLGIRVLIDAVPHHTSDRHPWFLAAREDTEGRDGKFFVWSDDDSTEPGDHPMFPGEEETVWTFDERAGRYYHHQFYSFQPDINATDPDVFEELVQLLTFWLGVGVDGFRIDAALLLVQGKGRPDTDVDDGAFFDHLRARLREVRPDVALVAEASEPPEAMATLIQNDRFDAVIDFSLSNATFLALARERAQPIVDALSRLDQNIPAESRLNFVRNADELDLSLLSDDERQEVFAAFAGDEDALIYGRGIRRGWAPMLQPAERVRMSLSLLHALPGVPLLLAGHELGPGDDLSVEGRGAARTTMQWDDSEWGGFTSAAASPLTLGAQVDGPFGFRTVNARAQEDDPGSLLSLARDLARVRREEHAAGAGWTTVDVGDPAVLALRRDGLLTLHNLSGREAAVDVGAGHDALLADGWAAGRLAPYGFAWLRTA